MYRHPFKNYIVAEKKRFKVDKLQLREDIIAATQVYLNAGNKIEKVPDGPVVKVPSVGMKDWGWEISAGMGDLYEEADTWSELTNLETELSAQLSEGDL
jgi:hypothetical protein